MPAPSNVSPVRDFWATDVSSFGVGAVLFHRFPDGSDRDVAHASKSVTPAKHNYSQIEHEALSIVSGTKKLPSRFDKVFDESQLAAEDQVTQVYNEFLLVASKELSDATAANPNLTLVAQHIQNGWPLKIKNFEINLFFRKRSELFFHYGCIF
ncbi:unnamed protein product [Enterobius vermicularis]|uniref:RT_RNaseH_2 domain-containing protein n=1 Tax=Enterobius vermicularis TaxID=51028 RepID=A0A0N4VJN6_ENTVE|nr:unnamed protein product [Enterobius vermicularis]